MSSSESTENMWKCPSCGAMNEDFRKFCDGCGDKRPGAAVATKGISMDEILGSGSSTSEESTETEEVKEKKPKAKKAKKEKKSKKKSEDEETAEPERLEPSIPEPEPFTSPKSEPADDFESKLSSDTGPSPSFVVTGPEPTPGLSDTSAKDTFSSFQSTSTVSAPPMSSGPLPAGQRYYLVFVNTPASSLIKTRVAIEFEDFPTVSIGRSPENVVVIPDPEVSRKHASLSFDGSRITLKDLGSSNGSFVYNGREFERVSDSVEVRPNTVIKFGTGTIVKLVSE